MRNISRGLFWRHAGSTQSNPHGGDAATQDPWGNMPLHHAAATPGAGAAVQRLIDGGANVQAPGAYGLPPLISAAVAGNHAAQRQLQASGATPTLGALNEPSWRGLLANAFGLPGTTRYSDHLLSLSGALAEGIYPAVASAFAGFCAASPLMHRIAPEDQQAIHAALQGAATAVCKSADDLASSAAADSPALVLGGWRGHSVCFIFFGRHAVSVNRQAALGGRRSCHLMAFGSQQDRRTCIHRVMSIRRRNVCYGFMELGLLAHRYPPGRAEAGLARLIAAVPHKRQKHPNCAMANAKAAVGALFAWAAQRSGAPDPLWLPALYKQFTTYLRLHILGRYMHMHSSNHEYADMALARACMQKLKKSGRLQGVPHTWGQQIECAKHHFSLHYNPEGGMTQSIGGPLADVIRTDAAAA